MRPPSTPTTISIAESDSKQIVIMKSLYNSLIEYKEPKTGRTLINLFMTLPSRKNFPAYFDIIQKPISMNKIKDKIIHNLYADENDCYEDLKLMFNNCKVFNEDGSQIFRDAKVLESILKKKREQLHLEFNSRDSKDATKEAILNSNSNSTTTTTTTTTSSQPSNNSTTTITMSSSPSTRSERLNNNNNNHVISTASSNSSPIKNEFNTSTNHINNKSTTSDNNNHISDSDSNQHTHSTITSVSNNKNGVPSLCSKETPNLQSDSTNHSTNGNDDLMDTSIKVNHNHHNDISMDSTSNLSAELIASTPIEKCSLNTRRGRNPDAPKRQLLTGYIIYASEIRKQVIDKNPNQNFGDISRLVGNEWKALPYDIRSKYDQRALIHNKRIREKAQRESHMAANADGDTSRLSNGLHTPKMTKRKLAKLAKEQMRQHHLSISGLHDDSASMSPRVNHEHIPSTASQQTPSSSFKSIHHLQPQTHLQGTSSKVATTETSTQTTAIRFVKPPTKKRLVYSETFKKYIENLQVPNRDLLVEETVPDRPSELPSHWLGAGIGRHESPEAALWALRDFMLQDAVTMRRSMEPYL